MRDEAQTALIEAEARRIDPEFWKLWDETPETRKFEWDYAAMVLKLNEARDRLGLLPC